MNMQPLTRTLFTLAAAITIAAPCVAQVADNYRFHAMPHRAVTGLRQVEAGSVFDEQGDKQLVSRYSTVVREAGVNLIRVHFGEFDLGAHSEIHIRSIQDGAIQRFTHDMLVEWDGWSAIFNGDAVIVQLLVAPGDSASFSITDISVNDPAFDHVGDGGGIATLCGSDNRVSSSDSRVGRLSGPNCGDGGGCGGCTAWLTSIGSAVTAGHCGAGQGGLIEFNVPGSASNGAPVAASPNDQYPVGTTWYAFQDGGTGFDWAIMSVGPNSNTGQRAHWVQGYFHLSPVLPSDGTTLRITGFGVDNTPSGSQPSQCCASSGGNCTHFGCNSSSLTLQTSTGPKSDDTSNRILYQVDTEPANSGSPVIRNSNGFAIGVHTHGGCTSGGGGANSGTRLTQSVLSTWLGNFLSDNYGAATFVSWANDSGLPFGQPLFPATTVPAGVGLVPSGGTVAIAGGNYTAAAGNTGVLNKSVTLRAVSGVVTIGN